MQTCVYKHTLGKVIHTQLIKPAYFTMIRILSDYDVYHCHLQTFFNC